MQRLRATGTPIEPNSHPNAAWLVPRPLTVTGSSMMSSTIGMRMKYIASAGIDPERPAETPCLDDADDLHANRHDEHVHELSMVMRVPADGVDHAQRRCAAARAFATGAPASRCASAAARSLNTATPATRQPSEASASVTQHPPVRARPPVQAPAPRRRQSRSPCTPEHAIHQDRRGRFDAADVMPRQAVGAIQIAADARQERADEGADEEDAQHRAERRPRPGRQRARADRSSGSAISVRSTSTRPTARRDPAPVGGAP